MGILSPDKLFRNADRWSNEFSDFVTKCLVRNPTNRPTARRLFRHPFVKNAVTELINNNGSSGVLKRMVERLVDWSEKISICDGLDLSFSRGVEEIVIGNKMVNEECNDLMGMKLDLSKFTKLKRIEIGDECFKSVREFLLDGLDHLESIHIGEQCFQHSNCILKSEKYDWR